MKIYLIAIAQLNGKIFVKRGPLDKITPFLPADAAFDFRRWATKAKPGGDIQLTNPSAVIVRVC